MKFEFGSNVVKLALISMIGTVSIAGINSIKNRLAIKKYCKQLRLGIALCDAYIEDNKDILTDEDIEEIRHAQNELRIKLVPYVV